MKKILMTGFVFFIVISFTKPLLAGFKSYGFNSGHYGFTGSSGDITKGGSFTNFFSIQNDNGKPAPCLKIKGIHGVGVTVWRPGFKGNFKALGFKQISMDIKIISWFLTPGQPLPVAKIFITPGYGMSPWVKTAKGFTPVIGTWQHISADINPNWTDTQAQAAGWHVVVLQGLPSKSFKKTIENVFSTGLWLRVKNAGAENHVLFDNYTLGLPLKKYAPAKQKILRKPLKPSALKIQ